MVAPVGSALRGYRVPKQHGHGAAPFGAAGAAPFGAAVEKPFGVPLENLSAPLYIREPFGALGRNKMPFGILTC